jgi:hypothetical protein
MYDVVVDALDTYFQAQLAALANPLDVAWEGVAYRPSASKPYLRIKVSGYVRTPAGVGADCVNVESGAYTVSVVYPVGSGRGAASGIAQQIAEMFPRGMSLELAGQAPLIIINATAAPAMTEGAWMTVPVSVYWVTTETAVLSSVTVSEDNMIYDFASAPADSVGSNGDYYINTTSTGFFGPKTNGVWPDTPLFYMQGPAGPPGTSSSNRFLTSSYSSVQATFAAALASSGNAYVYSAPGAYSETTAITATLGSYSLTFDGDEETAFTFQNGISGFAFSLENELQSVSVKGMSIISATPQSSPPAGAAISILSPGFTSGALPKTTKISSVQILGQWANGIVLQGVPDVVGNGIVISFPNANSTSVGISITGNTDAGIATKYGFTDCVIANGGGTAVNIGNDIQGVNFKNLVTYGQQYGIVWTNTTVAGDLLQVADSNMEAHQVLGLQGTSSAPLYNIQIADSTFNTAALTSGVPFILLNYCTTVTLSGNIFSPGVSGATISFTNCVNLSIVGGQLQCATLNLTGGNNYHFSNVNFNVATIQGAATNSKYDGCSFATATVFTGTGDSPIISGCKFAALPDFTAINPVLSNNYFAGVLYVSGAPASCLSGSYVPGAQQLVAATPQYYAQFDGGTNATLQVLTNVSNLIVETVNPTEIILPPAPTMANTGIQDLVITFAAANSAISWALGTGTQSFAGPTLPTTVVAGQQIVLRWIQFTNSWLNVSSSAGGSSITNDPQQTTMALTDFLGASIGGVDAKITPQAFFAALGAPVSGLSTGAASSAGDEILTLQSGSLVVNSMSEMWTGYFAVQATAQFQPVVNLSGNTVLDSSVHNNRKLVANTSLTLTPDAFASVGNGFSCTLIADTGATVTFGSGFTVYGGGTTLAPGQTAFINAFTDSASNNVVNVAIVGSGGSITGNGLSVSTLSTNYTPGSSISIVGSVGPANTPVQVAIGTSATVAPTSGWVSATVSGTNFAASITEATAGTYYIWAQQTGNTAIQAVSSAVTVASQTLTLNSPGSSGTAGTAIPLSGTVSPSGTGVQVQLGTSATVAPTGSWTAAAISGTSWTASLTPSSAGTYYVWAEVTSNTAVQQISSAITVVSGPTGLTWTLIGGTGTGAITSMTSYSGTLGLSTTMTHGASYTPDVLMTVNGAATITYTGSQCWFDTSPTNTNPAAGSVVSGTLQNCVGTPGGVYAVYAAGTAPAAGTYYLKQSIVGAGAVPLAGTYVFSSQAITVS